MTTLVTGAGLIGRLTAKALAESGDSAVLADLRCPDISEFAGPGRVIGAACDVTDMDALAQLIEMHSIRRIVHTAALLSTAIRQDPLAGIRVNVMGTSHVLECARRMGLGRIVLASSTTVGYNVFGSLGTDPIAEDAPMRMSSEQPASLYAVTKLTGEHLAGVYGSLYGVDVISLRYAAVLGGDASSAPTSVPGRLMHQLAAAGRSGQRIDLNDPYLVWGGREEFVDARDCATANVCALQAPAPRQRVFNIATGEWFSMEGFVQAMREVFPALSVHLPLEPATGFAGFAFQRPAPSSVSAALDQLGFRSRYCLADTFRHWCGTAHKER
jgi:UDP-glucose 4-epimerase